MYNRQLVQCVLSTPEINLVCPNDELGISLPRSKVHIAVDLTGAVCRARSLIIVAGVLQVSHRYGSKDGESCLADPGGRSGW